MGNGSDMDLKQLESLVAVADHRSFSAAAQALLTVQSNISTRIARLEAELGVVLVDRNSRRLTAEGAVVANRARSILDGVAAVPAELAALEDRVIGTAEIGLIGSTARWLVPLLLDYVRRELPEVTLRIAEAASGVVSTMVASGELNLGIINLPSDEAELTAQPLFEEDIYLVLPPDHRLAGKQNISIRDLADVEFMLPPAGSSYRSGIDESFRTARVPLRSTNAFEGIRLIESLAASGVAAAFLPASATPLDHVPPPLVVPGIVPRRVGTVTNPRRPTSLAVSAIQKALSVIVRSNISDLRGVALPARA